MPDLPGHFDEVTNPKEEDLLQFEGALKCRDEAAVQMILEDMGIEEHTIRELSAGELVDIVECVSLLMARVLRRRASTHLLRDGSVRAGDRLITQDQILEEVMRVVWEGDFDGTGEEEQEIRHQAREAILWLHQAATHQPRLFPHVTRSEVEEDGSLKFDLIPQEEREDDALSRWGYDTP